MQLLKIVHEQGENTKFIQNSEIYLLSKRIFN